MKLSMPTRAGTRFLLLVLLVVMVAAPLAHLGTVNRKSFHRAGVSDASDLTPPWVAARAALAGHDPYSQPVTAQIQTAIYGRPLTPADDLDPQRFAYPVHAIVLLAPFTRFSWPVVRLAYLILFPLLIAASVAAWLYVAEIRVSTFQLSLLAMAVVTSWPVIWGLRLQQLTLPVAILVAAGCLLLKRGHDLPAGVLFAMATIKPQLTAPLIAWLLLWTLLQRRWRFPAGFAAALGALLAGAQYLVPGWIPNWLAEVSAYASYTHSVPVLQRICGTAIGLAATGALALWTAYILWRLRRCSAYSAEFGLAISLALAMTLSATLSRAGWIYNQVLLVPALLLVVHARPRNSFASLARGIALTMLSWGFAAVLIADIVENFVDSSAIWDALPFANLLLPVAAVVALAAQFAPGQREPVREQLAAQPAEKIADKLVEAIS